ncbi:hypothetical protein ES705_18282 [subsurface metagenome]
MGELERKEEIQKERLERIKEMEKLDIEGLKERIKKLREECRLYDSKSRANIRAIEWAIKVKKVIGIYEKEGFEGVYAYAITEKSSYDDPEERGYTGEDIPF